MPETILPLRGVRVADFSRVVAGPYCSMLLADLGAEVIKVERPHSGDETRAWGPPYLGSESAYYLSLNRNKRSLCLDLKDSEERRLAYRLIARSQVMLHNFKPGDADKLQLDYASLQTHNPRLIYAHISGYGNQGPEAHKPGYDLLAQALSGLMSITGPADGEPHKVGVAIVDVLAGLNAALGIVAALYGQQTQAVAAGVQVSTSLLESGLSSLINVASNYLISQQAPKRHGNAHANIVPYQQFHASDAPLAIAVGNDGQFAKFAAILGQAQWADDPRYASNDARVRHRHDLVPAIAQVLGQHERSYWLEHLSQANIPCAPVLSIPEIINSEQSQANAMLLQAEHPELGRFPLLANGLKFDNQATPLYRPPPRLGQDDAALRAWLQQDSPSEPIQE